MRRVAAVLATVLATVCVRCSGFVPAAGPAPRAASSAAVRSQYARQRRVKLQSTSPIETETPVEADGAKAASGEAPTKTSVALRLYDIGNGMQPLISALLRKPFPHVWHVGVAVFGCEYWFSTRIEMMELENVEYAFGMAPIKVIELGETTRTREEFEAYLEDVLAMDYHADKYDVFFHNCNHFANDVSNFLVGAAVPQYVLDISEKALTSFGNVQASITKIVSNRMARYVMVSWGRATRAATEGDQPRKFRTIETKKPPPPPEQQQ